MDKAIRLDELRNNAEAANNPVLVNANNKVLMDSGSSSSMADRMRETGGRVERERSVDLSMMDDTACY
jgi:hypothetical protein